MNVYTNRRLRLDLSYPEFVAVIDALQSAIANEMDDERRDYLRCGLYAIQFDNDKS